MKRAALLLSALGLTAATPGLAQTQTPADELGAAVWHVVPFFQEVGFRESLAIHADRPLGPALRVRAGLRVSSAAALHGTLLEPGSRDLLGSFYEIIPAVGLLAGGDLGVARLQAGLGLGYQLRLAQTGETAAGLPIVPGAPGFGTLKSLGLSFDPGADAVAELSILTPLGFRVAVGAGLSAAPAQLFVQPRENPRLAIALPQAFLTWSVQLGLRYELRPRR